MANQEPTAAQENEDLQGHKVPRASMDLPENQAEMVILDRMVSQVVMDHQDQRVIVVKTVLPVYQGLQVILARLVTLAHPENQATEDSRDLLVQLAPLALPAFVVLLVLLVHVVIKVKLVNVVSMASKVIEGSLVTQDLPVHLGHWVLKVQAEVLDLQVLGVPLDQAGHLEKMVQAATLVPLAHQVLVEAEANLVLRAHQVTLVLQDLPVNPVLLVHAAVMVRTHKASVGKKGRPTEISHLKTKLT